jgi:broad specificity phosphatase PhoE
MLYLLPIPLDRLDRRERAKGWRHLPVDREGRKKLQTMCQQLKDRGVTEVYCSDLDEFAGTIVAEELKVPLVKDYQFRRFNVGKWHGRLMKDLDGILTNVMRKWQRNPDIPVKEGDSLTSFEKRWNKAYDKLLNVNCGAFVSDEQTLRWIRERKPEALVRNGNRLDMDKVYVLRRIEN